MFMEDDNNYKNLNSKSSNVVITKSSQNTLFQNLTQMKLK